jgi:hypothetical protein
MQASKQAGATSVWLFRCEPGETRKRVCAALQVLNAFLHTAGRLHGDEAYREDAGPAVEGDSLRGVVDVVDEADFRYSLGDFCAVSRPAAASSKSPQTPAGNRCTLLLGAGSLFVG